MLFLKLPFLIVDFIDVLALFILCSVGTKSKFETNPDEYQDENTAIYKISKEVKLIENGCF